MSFYKDRFFESADIVERKNKVIKDLIRAIEDIREQASISGLDDTPLYGIPDRVLKELETI